MNKKKINNRMIIEIEECISNCLKGIQLWEQFILTNNKINKNMLKGILRHIKERYKHIQYLERYNRKWERKDTRYI